MHPTTPYRHRWATLAALCAALLAPQVAQAASFPAVLEAKEYAVISAPFSGVLKSLPVAVGDRVEKGKPVAVLDTRELELNLNQRGQEASYWGQMESTYGRLLKNGLKTADDVQKAGFERKLAQGEAGILKHKIDKSGLEAPFSGQVSQVHFHAHEWVKEGDPILVLVNNERLYVIAFLPADLIARIKVGDEHKVVVDALGYEFSAKVAAINPAIDVKSNTFEVRWITENPEGRLLHGMKGAVTLE